LPTTPQRQLQPPSGATNQAEMSPDGERLATIDSDAIARLWNTNGKLIAELKVPLAPSQHSSYASQSIANKTWNVDGLTPLLTQGCTWLRGYFISHPDALQRLPICQNH
jgi:WD40 repeat protein